MEERKRARKLNFKKRAWALTTNESGSSEYYQHLAWTAYGAYLRVKNMQGTSMKNEDRAPLMRLTAVFFSNAKKLIFFAYFVC